MDLETYLNEIFGDKPVPQTEVPGDEIHMSDYFDVYASGISVFVDFNEHNPTARICREPIKDYLRNQKKNYINVLKNGIITGDIELIYHLKDQFTLPHAKSVLGYCIGNGHADMVQLMIDWGVELNEKKFINGLLVAVSRGHIEMLQLAREKGLLELCGKLDLVTRSRDSKTIIWFIQNEIFNLDYFNRGVWNHSIEKGNMNIMQCIVKSGFNPNLQRSLENAIYWRQLEIVKYLVDLGACLDHSLHKELLVRPHLPIIKYFIESGSDLSDIANKLCLHSIDYDNFDDLRYYLNQWPEDLRPNLLETAIDNNQLEIIKLLIEEFQIPLPDIWHDHKKYSAEIIRYFLTIKPPDDLNIILSQSHISDELFQLFLELNLNIDDQAQHLLDVCRADYSVVSYLLTHHPGLDTHCILSRSIMYDKYETVRYLVELGAIPSREDMDRAFDRGSLETITFLLNKFSSSFTEQEIEHYSLDAVYRGDLALFSQFEIFRNESALICAIKQNKLDLVKYLANNLKSQLALETAVVKRGNGSMVQLLLEQEVGVIDQDILQIAREYGNEYLFD